jgi:reductive dehalogenase
MQVDWQNMQRHAGWQTTLRSFADYVGKERNDRLNQLQAENLDRWLKQNKPGYTLKDRALNTACGQGAGAQSFLPPKDAPTPATLGVPKWTGSPEDAALMLTAAMRFLGAGTVGFVQLDTNTTEKLIYAQDPDRKEMKIADVDQPSEDDKARVIPKKARWAIVWTIPMSQEMMKTAPTVLGQVTALLGYTLNRSIQLRLQYFLAGLGYLGLGESATNALGIAPAFGTMAGLGEMSRLNRMITPEWGPIARVFKALTDLPLAPTQPINAGIMEFCKVCKKCAEFCPSKALSFDTEPTWQVRGPWSNPGHKAFFEDATRCQSYWRQVGTGCGICYTACPFSTKNQAFFHAFRNALAATTPIFDGALKAVDDWINPGPENPEMGNPFKDPEAWWKRTNLPIHGFNSSSGLSEI